MANEHPRRTFFRRRAAPNRQAACESSNLMNARHLSALLALAIAAPCGFIAVSSESFAQTVRVEAQGCETALPGVCVFVPQGLDPRNLPYSGLFSSRPGVEYGRKAQASRQAPVFEQDGSLFRARLAVAADDDLYGTGEVTGPLRRNGRSIALWNTDNYAYETDEGRRLYQSHPWVLGLRRDGTAYGVLFDSTWKAELACGDELAFTSQGPAFPVYLVEGASPKEVLRTLAQMTGTLPLPPRWALGYHQARWSYQPDARVLGIAEQFRRRRIPCDVLWMDIDYMDRYRIFTFSPVQFPKPAELNETLHRKRFKTVWIIDPGVKAEPGYSVFDAGTAKDFWVKTADGEIYRGEVWPGSCVFPDFTQTKVRRWWASLYRDFLKTGADGVWNDMNEPAIFEVPGKAMPEDNRHKGDGEFPAGPHLRYRNIYGMLMARATREGLLCARPDKRPFVLTRASFLGGQRYAATWTGDNASTEEHLRLSVPMTLNLGLSGQPFSGPDLGGFAGNATAELWSRWIGFGAFFPFCRGHASKGSNDKEPWAFGPEVENTARMALERRYRLLPYLYTVFREASVEGLPVMRPLFLQAPSEPSLRREERAFLLGDDLLVRPTWAEDAPLPPGRWRKISLVPGDLEAVDQATLLLREGSIVPLGKVVQNTEEDSFAPLTLLVSLDAAGKASGKLYEDAGDGFGYAQGDYLLTTYKAERSGGTLKVSVESVEGRRPRPTRTVQIVEVGEQGQKQPEAAHGL